MLCVALACAVSNRERNTYVYAIHDICRIEELFSLLHSEKQPTGCCLWLHVHRSRSFEENILRFYQLSNLRELEFRVRFFSYVHKILVAYIRQI